ncbi:MAG: dTDP-4-dehydrorhamnose reductase [Candidatus Fermentimicrarchaeum limneticum]|uniref:dTDP-4-dehydrorhamnose reductase n=1 Tax=Fermentimicrarchaeum limneticum TaxID=2795018 RepID=A0A7D6BVL4_FERL1|nr:MAG: dTDP-4-dehydrorhamnose reductase [Candidatus Fermentimicrarchaeum limneticum]
MKVLVVGGSGLLGSRVVKMFSTKFETYATYTANKPPRNKCELIEIDIRKAESVRKIMEEVRPAVVVHTAALTDVDYCEGHKREARMLNVAGTKNLIDGCGRVGASMIYISTDYVFDGKRGDYLEEDSVNPISYYGKTKLEGEKLLAESRIDCCIGRVSVVYGWNGPWQRLNFVTWVIKSLKEGSSIRVVDDQYNTPTLADNAAEAVYRMVEKNAGGIYHITGAECVNRYEFAMEIAKVFGLDSSKIARGKTAELNQLAKRPFNSCLSTKKAERELGYRPLKIHEGLDVMRRQRGYEGWLNGN